MSNNLSLDDRDQHVPRNGLDGKLLPFEVRLGIVRSLKRTNFFGKHADEYVRLRLMDYAKRPFPDVSYRLPLDGDREEDRWVKAMYLARCLGRVLSVDEAYEAARRLGSNSSSPEHVREYLSGLPPAPADEEE